MKIVQNCFLFGKCFTINFMTFRYRCISETSVVLGHFENEITPYAGTKRYWTTIAAFKFYNSFDVYIMCTVTVCPDSSSSCDIVSKVK